MKRLAYLSAIVGAALPITAAPLHAQQLGGGGGIEVPLLRMVAALVVSLGAGLALALLLRRRGARLPARLKWLEGVVRPGRIELVETRRIATQAELSLVRCEGQEYLILSGPGTAQVIKQRPVAIEGRDGEAQ